MDQQNPVTEEDRRQTRDNDLRYVGEGVHVQYFEGSYPGQTPAEQGYSGVYARHSTQDAAEESSSTTNCQYCSDAQVFINGERRQCPHCGTSPQGQPVYTYARSHNQSNGSSVEVQGGSSASREDQYQTMSTDDYGGYGGHTAFADNVDGNAEDNSVLDRRPVSEPPSGGQNGSGGTVGLGEQAGRVVTPWNSYNRYDPAIAYQVCDEQIYLGPQQS